MASTSDIMYNNRTLNQLSKSQLAHLRESAPAKEHRLARNAERMREKRARESCHEYRKRLEKNACINRLQRQRESATDKAMRQIKDAARQRLRRAMETQEARCARLRKLAQRMRTVRKNETPEKKSERLARAAQRARERLHRETSKEREVRLHKSCEYARRIRTKSKNSSTTDNESIFDVLDQKPSVCPVDIICNPYPITYEERNSDIQHVRSASKGFETSTNYNYLPSNIIDPLYSKNFTSTFETLPVSNGSLFNGTVKHTPELYSPQVAQCQNICDFKTEDIVKLEFVKCMDMKPKAGECRLQKLQILAEKCRMRRRNESREQRGKRLNDLRDRARRRRELVKISETESERKSRLALQAQYARLRRRKLKEFEENLCKERKIRDRFDKTQDVAQFMEKPSVLKILEPIIEMDSFS